MLSKENIQQIAEKGLSESVVMHQLQQFANGFPFLKLQAAAAIGNGIMALDEQRKSYYEDCWNKYKGNQHKIIKFVPASGAASRMFKDLFEFLHAAYQAPQTPFEKDFCQNIKRFAFREALCDKCKANNHKNIKTLLAEGDYKTIVANLLGEKGLNYGNLPKGLLLFYNYEDAPRTAMEEHLAEAALYANCNGEAYLHFTVSHEHLALFEKEVAEKVKKYEEMFGIQYHISFSEQKPSTDTIAANPDNTLFLNEDGSLLFRPGGHGALIENLNELDADVVFIKNIDNVVPDKYKADTVTYKQILAGVLVDMQQKIFGYLQTLDKAAAQGKICDRTVLNEIEQFLHEQLHCVKEDAHTLSDEALTAYLRTKLNRPIRVCGVVKNVGEPGGGPFLAYNADGTVSLQILESSQIDKDNADYMRMFKEGTHFNPVDIVCGLKDYQGKAFNLPQYVDRQTGFISTKSKNGKTLKALELPGLWNGAMSDWNTVCVEVPLSTFNPVKTVNDLLKMSE